NPDLEPYETDGVSSGTLDDRWVFTTRSRNLDYATAGALAAAARPLRAHNPELAERAMASARKLLADNEGQEPAEGGPGFFGNRSEMGAALQMFITTGDETFVRRFEELLWSSLDE